MRPRISLGTMLLLLAFLSPAALMAQFQAPSEEELKMTAEPRAPGAAAVYLYREDVTDDRSHQRSYYDRIKIITEKGKGLATVNIPYERGDFKVASLKGRTIHPDGTSVALSVKPEDVVNRQENAIVFTMPAVEAGSILEYRVQLLYNQATVLTPHWIIQQPYFIRKAHYSFRPGDGVMTNSEGDVLDRLAWSATSQLIAVEQVKGSYVVDLAGIPALPQEEWMPPLNTIEWSVAFYYTGAYSAEDFWKTEGGRWADDVETFMGPPGTLKDAVASLVSANDTDDDKARKIYAAMMKLDNMDFHLEGADNGKRADAEDVWKEQSGDGNSIALLYAALLREAGVQAWPMKVVNRGRAIFSANYLSMSQLDDVVVIAVIDGEEVYLDPGERMCAFGSLHWEHELAGGIRTSAKGTSLAVTPAGSYKDNLIQREGDLTVSENGEVSGSVRYNMSGPRALYWRQLALENDETEVKKEFVKTIQSDLPEGVDAQMNYFVGLDDYESPLTAVVDVSGTMGSATEKQIVLPGLFFEAGAQYPFVSANKRTAPIDMHYGEEQQDDVTYELPEGATVVSSPKGADVKLTDSAILHIDSAAANHTLEVLRQFARNIVLFDPDDYADLHDFYQKAAAADKQQIVLTKPDASTGN